MYILAAIRGAPLVAHAMALSFLLATASSQKQQNFELTRASPFDAMSSRQQQQQQQQQQPVSGENQDELGEHVDRMASASGDLYWNKQQPQHQHLPLPASNWYRKLHSKVQGLDHRPIDLSEATVLEVPLARQYQLVLSLEGMRDQPQQDGLMVAPVLGRADKRQLSGYPAQLITAGQLPMEFGFNGMDSYRELVDHFKHWSPVANPSREGRAFKPKIMSTARGFGKRAQPVGGGKGAGGLRQVTYADFLVPSNVTPLGVNIATAGDGGKQVRK